MTDQRTTIKIEITAFDEHATATYRTTLRSDASPAEGIADIGRAITAAADVSQLAAMLRAEQLRVQQVTERAERAEARTAAAEAALARQTTSSQLRIEETIEAERVVATYREKLAAVSGLGPCDLDADESEAPSPNASPDLDTDAAATRVVIEWASVCTDPAKLRRAIEREQARATATPRKVVRSGVIAACEKRLLAIEFDRLQAEVAKS